jgi:hypothetical protein
MKLIGHVEYVLLSFLIDLIAVLHTIVDARGSSPHLKDIRGSKRDVMVA